MTPQQIERLALRLETANPAMIASAAIRDDIAMAAAELRRLTAGSRPPDSEAAQATPEKRACRPCPCGSERVIVMGGGNLPYWCRCRDCGRDGMLSLSAAAATDQWNEDATRKPAASDAPATEEPACRACGSRRIVRIWRVGSPARPRKYICQSCGDADWIDPEPASPAKAPRP